MSVFDQPKKSNTAFLERLYTQKQFEALAQKHYKMIKALEERIKKLEEKLL